MSARQTKKPAARPGTAAGAVRAGAKPASAARLRAQTRRLLGKHYRAKYGVR